MRILDPAQSSHLFMRSLALLPLNCSREDEKLQSADVDNESRVSRVLILRRRSACNSLQVDRATDGRNRCMLFLLAATGCSLLASSWPTRSGCLSAEVCRRLQKHINLIRPDQIVNRRAVALVAPMAITDYVHLSAPKISLALGLSG